MSSTRFTTYPSVTVTEEVAAVGGEAGFSNGNLYRLTFPPCKGDQSKWSQFCKFYRIDPGTPVPEPGRGMLLTKGPPHQKPRKGEGNREPVPATQTVHAQPRDGDFGGHRDHLVV